MKASENRRSVIVGIFVLVGIVILIAGIFVLGGQQNHFARTVTVTATFPDVAGLKAGNNVWFSGVKVGTVKKIEFKSLETVEVQLTIEEKSREFIRKDATAILGTDGFIGNKLILIEGGSGQAPPIEDGDVLTPGASSGLDAMLETLQVNNQNVVGITENLHLLLTRLNEGQGTIGAVLNDSVMAANVQAMLQHLNTTAANSARASQMLVDLTTKLNREGSLVHDLLTDTLVYADLRAAVTELRGITGTAGGLMDNLQAASAQLTQRDNAAGLLLNDSATAEQVKRTLENLESSTEKLDQNMEALQHNFLFRGFFRRQAKEAAQESDSAKTTR